MSRRITQRRSKDLSNLIGKRVTVETGRGYIRGRLRRVPQDTLGAGLQGYFIGDQHIRLGDVTSINPDERTICVRFLKIEGRGYL